MVSTALDVWLDKDRTIALCEFLANGGIVALIMALDVERVLPERVAEL